MVCFETKKYVKYAEYVQYFKYVKYVYGRRWLSENVNNLLAISKVWLRFIDGAHIPDCAVQN